MRTSSPIALALIVVLAACQQAATTQPAAPRSAAAPPVATATPPAQPAQPSPAAKYDALDKRGTVTLLPMMAEYQKETMRDRLFTVQEIVAALGRKDFETVAAAAKRIGSNAHAIDLCKQMGAATPSFADAELLYLRTADGIAAAADEKDMDRVHVALARTLETCTNCHATYKQKLVDEQAWVKGTAAPNAPAAPLP